MSGCYKDLLGRIKIVAPHVAWSHCCIHRQSLAAKSLPDSLKEVLNQSVKVVNFIKANSTNTRLFKSLCGDMDSLHTTLEDRITHGGQVPSNRTPIEVYTDGSKINDQTGSAFCVIANEAITKTWKAKLRPANTVFQAEMLALKAAIEWANTANEDVNIWSDSESRIQALKSFNVKSKITQEAQMTLLENARIRLDWVKAHIGIKGNEIADTLSKEATTDGIPASLPFPKSFLKKQLLQLSLSHWQAEWDNGETGRSVYSILPKISNKQLHWSRECIQFATGHGPFPSYLKRLSLHSTYYCGCGEIGNPLHYETRCPLTLSYHHKEPSPQFIVHWWKSALSRKLSRQNIDNLITFLATNEDLIKCQNTTPSHTAA
ncbi:hypothetical protein AVEN_92554-1 [Araneus ventricosus]|uniref:RNase H type-1 domain-containing protein n=1 Tax=Araneus ventricosus TaxID=182803 RepID=A0A4Y2AJA6_ARAVE|nr:hypothetical protein AVEN_92554-1 [Araneus ventricosus]